MRGKVWTWIKGKGKTLAIVVGAIVLMAILAGGLYQIRQAISSVDRKVDGVKSSFAQSIGDMGGKIATATAVADAAGITGTKALELAQTNAGAINATNAKVAKLEKDLAELRQVAVGQLAEHELVLRGEDGKGGLQGDVKALQSDVKKQDRRISALERSVKKLVSDLEKAWDKFRKWDQLGSEPEVDKDTSASGVRIGPPV